MRSDEVLVENDAALAALMVYAGGEIVRCIVTRTTTTWLIADIKSCDQAIYLDEYQNKSDASVLLKPYVAALKDVQRATEKARANHAGEFIAGRYTRGK